MEAWSTARLPFESGDWRTRFKFDLHAALVPLAANPLQIHVGKLN